MLHLAVISLLCHLRFGTSQKLCYWPDESIAAVDTPCNASAPVSSCCRSDSFCLDNGLCLPENAIVRGSCTERSWSIECFTYCYDETHNAPDAIIYCGTDANNNMFYACRKDRTCSINFTLVSDGGIMLRKEQAASLGYSGPIVLGANTIPDMPSSSCSTQTPVSTATSAANLTSDTLVGHSKVYTSKDMAAVGAGIGIPLLLAVVFLGVLVYKRRRDPSPQHRLSGSSHPPISPSSQLQYLNAPNDWTQPSQLQGDAVPVLREPQTMKSELSTGLERQELGAHSIPQVEGGIRQRP